MYTEARQNFKNKKVFLGLRNLSQSRRQPEGEDKRTVALAIAKNVDVDDEGGVISRPGYTKTLPGTSITAGYSRRDNEIAYHVDNGVLYSLDSNLTITALGSVPTTDTYWTEVGNRVFMSTGYIVDNQTLIPWLVPVPDEPIAYVVSQNSVSQHLPLLANENPFAPLNTTQTGSLLEGQYQIVVTNVMPDGRESGSSYAVPLDVPANSQIQLVGTKGCNVYCTKPNDGTFYLIGYETTLIDKVKDTYYPIDKDLLFGNPLPDNIGQIAYFNERMYYTVYNQVNHFTEIGWSKSFRFHVFDVFQEYIRVPGEVFLFAGMSDAIIIGTDKEIFAYNGEELERIARYGVPRGHNYIYNRDNSIFFQTNRGVCTWPFQNVSGDKVALPMGQYVTMGWVDVNGMEKVITMSDGSGITDNATIF